MAAVAAPGFDGSPARLERVREALAHVDRAFPQHLEAARVPGLLYPEDVERNERLDAIVRSHEAPRLAFDTSVLQGGEGGDHASMQLRRFAWFVPALLASWLESRPLPPFARLHGHVIQSMLEEATIAEEDDASWQPREAVALASFFDAALVAALATPIASLAAAPSPMPFSLEPEVGAAPRSLETIELAVAMRVPPAPLVTRWLEERTPFADEHLSSAVSSPTGGWSLLAEARVVQHLAEAAARSSGARAARYEEAASRLRRYASTRHDPAR